MGGCVNQGFSVQMDRPSLSPAKQDTIAISQGLVKCQGLATLDTTVLEVQQLQIQQIPLLEMCVHVVISVQLAQCSRNHVLRVIFQTTPAIQTSQPALNAVREHTVTMTGFANPKEFARRATTAPGDRSLQGPAASSVNPATSAQKVAQDRLLAKQVLTKVPLVELAARHVQKGITVMETL